MLFLTMKARESQNINFPWAKKNIGIFVFVTKHFLKFPSIDSSRFLIGIIYLLYFFLTPVDPPAPSCQEGHYLPKFVQPTPENGARIQAEVNKEVEIRVKAQATYAT